MVNLVTSGGASFRDIELIIFDKDGTLFELYPYWSKVARSRAENICRLIGEDSPAFVSEIVYLLGVRGGFMDASGPIGVRSREYSQSMIYQLLLSRGYSVNSGVIRQGYDEADKFMSDPGVLSEAIAPVPGIEPFLEKLSGKCQCAIFSQDRTDSIRNILKLKDYEKHFHFILGGDRVFNPKPHPEGIRTILDVSKILPEKTLVIGDSLQDFLCGVAAGCRYFIARRSDITGPDLRPDALVEDFTEVEVL